jgi:molecular chaperone GrpE
MQVESADHEEGVIVEEIQKGYKLKDKVIRPAMVKVSK